MTDEQINIMKKRTKVKRQGNALVVLVTQECRDMGLDVGDYVDVTLERIKE